MKWRDRQKKKDTVNETKGRQTIWTKKKVDMHGLKDATENDMLEEEKGVQKRDVNEFVSHLL